MEKFINALMATVTAILTCVAPVILLSQNAYAFESTNKVHCTGTGFNNEPIQLAAEYSAKATENLHSGIMALHINNELKLFKEVQVTAIKGYPHMLQTGYDYGDYSLMFVDLSHQSANASLHEVNTRVGFNMHCEVTHL